MLIAWKHSSYGTLVSRNSFFYGARIILLCVTTTLFIYIAFSVI